MSYPSSRPLWVYFILNGDEDPLHSVKVNIAAVPDLPSLFNLALDKLRLSQFSGQIQLARVFSQEGIEIMKIDQIYPDDRLYFAQKDEPFVETDPKKKQQNQQQNDPNDPSNLDQPSNANDGYLYTAALYTSAIVSTTYGAFSHAVRTHAPQQIVNSFSTFEDTVQYYSQPLAQSTIPYISSSVMWTDQMLNQAIVTTTQKTNDFLQTPTGQKVSALKDNVSEYATKAVESFKSSINSTHQGPGHNGNNDHNDDNAQNGGERQQQTYMTNLKESLGGAWNDNLAPWAKATYHHLGAQVASPTSQQQWGEVVGQNEQNGSPKVSPRGQ